MGTYEYLKEFLPPHPEYDGTNRNWFYPVEEKSIGEAEKRIGFDFPNQLKAFYREIGYGSLYAPHDITDGYQTFLSNKIFPPSMVADIMINGPESGLIIDSFYELLEPGDLPFFEIGDSTRFLIMKLYSDNPNAIWAFGNIKIEDSFEKFIWRLYYESPWFYDDIIEAHYKNLSSSLK